MMNNNELQMLRKALFLDIVEAAELVGGVSARTWQRWEKGDINVPFDVEQKMRKLNHIHNKVFNLVLSESSEYCYKYYDYEQFTSRFGTSKLKWRLYQSVLSRLYQVFGDPVSVNYAPDDCSLYKYFEELEI
ncbi:DUF1870 family protein [Pasteurella multocida]|uniref:Aca2/YdiL-like domain-containing protein n=1 Tax=Pasteurella multocida TaxID=747 RepID=UPI001F52FB77|nr:DUF1870 family protein [Pasteurella multocida]HDR1187531.1 DUF1870 family protein [Pasteurella multocida]HDR1354465.1 DUF1870 family protein [Pasteurella multocida]